MSADSLNFDKFIEDMEKKASRHKKRIEELASDEAASKNRERALRNKEDWHNRVRWSR